MITAFNGQYRFLSNFYPSEVTLDGNTYRTVEHAYQASKTLNPKQREKIANAPTPGKAKYLGRSVQMRNDFNNLKIKIMSDLIAQKFRPGTQLAEKLKATGNTKLVEYNHWGDTFWGICHGQGENHLGKILTQTRTELQKNKTAPKPDTPDKNHTNTLLYAGIGSRQTPINIGNDMIDIARRLANNGWTLRSGGADGADTYFVAGVTHFDNQVNRPKKEIIIPWNNFNHLKEGDPGILLPLDNMKKQYADRARSIEPHYDSCSHYVKNLKERNIAIIEGPEMNQPVKAVICWTPDGLPAGGTALGIRHARMLNIPVFNMFDRSPDTILSALQAIKDKETKLHDHEQTL